MIDDNNQDFDQRRFIFAMILSGLVLVVWQVFFAPEPPPPPTGDQATQTATQQADGDPAQVAEKSQADDQPVVDLSEKVEEPPAKEVPVVEHEMVMDELRVVLSSRGARVKTAEVLKPDQYSQEGNLLGGFPDGSKNFPFAVTFTGDSLSLPNDLVYEFAPEESEKANGTWKKVTYRWVDPQGRFRVDKTYELDPDNPYQLDFAVTLVNQLDEGRISDHLAVDIFGYKDPEEESSFLDMRPDEVEGVCKLSDDVEREMISSVDSTLSFDESPILWGAIDTRYFLFAAVPAEEGIECMIDLIDEAYLRTRIVQDKFSVGPRESHTASYALFLGPKDYDILAEAGHGLEEAVDYGLLTFLARPLRWMLKTIYGWVGNWGLAIIFLTFVIRLALWPINHKVYANSQRMKDVQPQLKEMREKYKDDQQKLAEETMKIFKENNVSPLGCAPMLLQFPILLALYYMILNSVELYRADFALWYVDLSAPDPYFVLPVLMGFIMFAQQSFMTMDTGNAQMKTVMKIMPVTMTALFLFLPSGVVLYYFVSLVIGLLQQWLIKRKFEGEAAPA